MTTTVKIEAHCDNATEVELSITDNGKQVEFLYLNDGDEADRYVYDGRVISVRETRRSDRFDKVEPLKSRTMTLRKLQHETLKLINQVRDQLNRSPHEDGLSDSEFADQVLSPLETKIQQDQDVIKLMGAETEQ